MADKNRKNVQEYLKEKASKEAPSRDGKDQKKAHSEENSSRGTRGAEYGSRGAQYGSKNSKKAWNDGPQDWESIKKTIREE